MIETTLSFFSTAFAAIPFTAAAWAVIITLVMFVWLFGRASRDPNSPIKWEHLIIDSSNDRASPYKMGFLLGGLVATWIVVTLTDKDKLSFDIFGLYLTYLLGGAGFNSFMKTKGAEANPAPADDEPKQ
jgi:apolipoprotein N-acyltransferase